jgi:hypothetical protein
VYVERYGHVVSDLSSLQTQKCTLGVCGPNWHLPATNKLMDLILLIRISKPHSTHSPYGLCA